MRVPKFGASPATSAGYRAPRAVGVPTPPGLQQSQELAQAMSTFGQGLGALGEQMQAEVDEAEVQSAANKFDEYTRGVLDPMKGFRSKLGRDAKDGYEQAVQDLEGKRKEFGNTLQNARQRELYERYSNSRRDRTRSFLDNHAATQVRAYNIGEKKATVDGHAQDYVGLMTLPTPDDPAAAARLMQERRYALAELRQTTGDYADLQGQGPQERAQTVRNAERAAHAGVVQGLIAAGRYDEAEAMMRTGDDDAGIDYYMDDAIAAGIEPEDGHWASRVPNGPNRGMILKKPHHPTFHKTLKGEKAAGMKWFYRPDNGRYYTFPDGENPGEEYAEQEPSAEEMRASLTPLEREKYRAQIKNGRAVQAKLLDVQQAQQLAAQRASDLQNIVDAARSDDVQESRDRLMDDQADPTPAQVGQAIRRKAAEYADREMAAGRMDQQDADKWMAQAEGKVQNVRRTYLEESQAELDTAVAFLRQNPDTPIEALPNYAQLVRYRQDNILQAQRDEAMASQMEAAQGVVDAFNEERKRLVEIFSGGILETLAAGEQVQLTRGLMAEAAQLGVDMSDYAVGDVLQFGKMSDGVVKQLINKLQVTKSEKFNGYYRKWLSQKQGVTLSQEDARANRIDAQKDVIAAQLNVKLDLMRKHTIDGKKELAKYHQLKEVLGDDSRMAKYGISQDSPSEDWVQASHTIAAGLSNLTLEQARLGRTAETFVEDDRELLWRGLGISPSQAGAISQYRAKDGLQTDMRDLRRIVEEARAGKVDPELQEFFDENVRGPYGEKLRLRTQEELDAAKQAKKDQRQHRKMIQHDQSQGSINSGLPK